MEDQVQVSATGGMPHSSQNSKSFNSVGLPGFGQDYVEPAPVENTGALGTIYNSLKNLKAMAIQSSLSQLSLDEIAKVDR